jgi:hypothetical protein
VLLGIEAATELVVGHQPWDTYYRCCFVLCGEMYSAKEVAMAHASVMRAFSLRAHISTDGGVLLLTVALPKLLFLVRFVSTWSEVFSPSPFFWPAIRA